MFFVNLKLQYPAKKANSANAHMALGATASMDTDVIPPSDFDSEEDSEFRDLI